MSIVHLYSIVGILYLTHYNNYMLKTNSISHTYTGGSTFRFPDIFCKKKDTLLVLGKSGAGKTTLLHILAGILSPIEGEVVLDGTVLYEMSRKNLDRYRGQNIGLVFQKPHFVQSISAEENLLLSQKMAGQKQDKARVKSILEKLNIYHRKDAKNYNMSQGEQQRLSIARALINDPKVILADEPTSALDDHNCQSVVQLLQEQSIEVGAALVIVTHDNRLKNVFHNCIEIK